MPLSRLSHESGCASFWRGMDKTAGGEWRRREDEINTQPTGNNNAKKTEKKNCPAFRSSSQQAPRERHACRFTHAVRKQMVVALYNYTTVIAVLLQLFATAVEEKKWRDNTHC